jgi:hypothetical protein
MQFLKPGEKYSLSDLLKPETLSQLGRILSEMFSELVVCERVNTGELTANENRIYALCSNPKAWERFTPKERYKRRKQFEEIMQAKGKTNWKQVTAKLISEKWAMLLTLSKSGHVLTNHQIIKSGDNLTDLPKTEKRLFNRLDNLLIPTLPGLPCARTCKTCGRDISHQKKESIFCSAKDVGYKEAHRCRNKDSGQRRTLRKREARKSLNAKKE